MRTREETEAMLTGIIAGGGFHDLMAMQLTGFDMAAGTVDVRLPWRPEFQRMPGTLQWHGGPIAALIDTAGDLALAMVAGGGIPTINLRIDYLRQAVDTDLYAHAAVVRAGRTIGTVDIDVRDKAGKSIAVGRGTYLMAVG